MIIKLSYASWFVDAGSGERGIGGNPWTLPIQNCPMISSNSSYGAFGSLHFKGIRIHSIK
jgi:hypothetical protein